LCRLLMCVMRYLLLCIVWLVIRLVKLFLSRLRDVSVRMDLMMMLMMWLVD